MTFVPENFAIPKKLQTDTFLLRMLTIHDVDKDYDAAMSSIDYIHGVFGREHDWPTSALTKEQDLIDLG